MTRKTEVYTWRLSPATKAALEGAARRQGRTVSQLLDEMVSEKLQALGAEDDEDLQRELHERAEHFAGCLTGSDRQRAANARALVRARLNRRASHAS